MMEQDACNQHHDVHDLYHYENVYVYELFLFLYEYVDVYEISYNHFYDDDVDKLYDYHDDDALHEQWMVVQKA